MKGLIFFMLTYVASLSLPGQDMKTFRLYKPKENATVELDKLISLAKANSKHVFVQIGGNWCIWCARFNEFITSDQKIDSLISKNFVVYHLNYSLENTNKDLMKRFSFPQRFGFPVFVILDGDGKRLHTQASAYLEQGRSYHKDKVFDFFLQWSPGALDPDKYKNF